MVLVPTLVVYTWVKERRDFLQPLHMKPTQEIELNLLWSHKYTRSYRAKIKISFRTSCNNKLRVKLKKLFQRVVKLTP